MATKKLTLAQRRAKAMKPHKKNQKWAHSKVHVAKTVLFRFQEARASYDRPLYEDPEKLVRMRPKSPSVVVVDVPVQPTVEEAPQTHETLDVEPLELPELPMLAPSLPQPETLWTRPSDPVLDHWTDRCPSPEPPSPGPSADLFPSPSVFDDALFDFRFMATRWPICITDFA